MAEEDLAAAEETQRRQDLRVAAKEAAEAADLALARERAEASSRKKRTLGLDPESCSLPEILVDLPDHVSVLARGSLQMKVELKAHPLPVTYRYIDLTFVFTFDIFYLFTHVHHISTDIFTYMFTYSHTCLPIQIYAPRWFFRSATSVSSNFTQIPMSNSSSLTLKRVTRLMTGQYYVQCSNDDGSTKSSVCVLRLGLIRWTRESFGRSPHVPYAISYQELSKSISTWSGRCLQSWKALDEDHHHHQGKEQWTIRRSISMTNTRVVAFSTTHVATLTSDTSFSVRSLAESKGEPFVEIVKKTRAKIKMICWANFGQWLITCDAQSFVSVYDIQSTNHRPIIRQRLTSPDETIDVMAMDSFTHGSDVTVAVAMSTGLQILVFSSTLLECTATHAPMYPKARVTCASWSSCGSILALGQRHGGRQNGTISLISGQTRTTTTRKKKKFRVISQAHLGTIESITWTLNDHVLVSIGQEDGLLKLWGPLPQLECCIGTLECHATGITASYISRNLETVLTCGYDRRLCVWNIRPESQSMIDALGREQDSAARIIQAFLRKNF